MDNQGFMHEINHDEYNYSGDIYKYKFYNLITNGGDFNMDLKNNFSKITKSLSESASNVVQKSNELIAVSALNGEISNEEKKKDIIYIAIGKEVYNSFINKAELSGKFKHKCEAILEHDEQIKIIMEKIINVKRIKKCLIVERILILVSIFALIAGLCRN